LKLLAIVESSQNVSTGLLSNPAFLSIPDETRNKYINLFERLPRLLPLLEISFRPSRSRRSNNVGVVTVYSVRSAPDRA
jgi:hypothetical protein